MNEATPTPEVDPKVMVDSRLRSVLKAISWRLIGTMDTFVVSFMVMHFVGGQNTDTAQVAKLSGGIAATEVVTKVLLYYFHERAWARVPLGTVRRFYGWVGMKPKDS